MDHPTLGDHTSLRSQNDPGGVLAARSAAREEQLCENQKSLLSPFQSCLPSRTLRSQSDRLVRQGAKRRTEPSVLAPSEIKSLLTGLELRERALVLLAASTGLRQSELFGVNGATSISLNTR